MKQWINNQAVIDLLLLGLGVVSFVVCLLVDITSIRFVFLLIVIFVVGYFLFSFKKQSLVSRKIKSILNVHSEINEMKKLIFDDLQDSNSGKYKVQEIHCEDVKSAESTDYKDREISTIRILKPEAKPTVREFEVSDFFDVNSEIFKNEPEPKTEFNFLLNKVLIILKEMLFAHTVVFFWVNRQKGQMVIEAKISDSPKFLSTRRFPIGHDLVSCVGETGKPELLSQVNPISESELFPYYESPANVKSFLAVPVYYTSNPTDGSAAKPIAVLVVDSIVEDAFGTETLAMMGNCTKLISALIKSHTEKYDLMIRSELLLSLQRMRNRVRNDFTRLSIIRSLTEEATKLVSWDFISVVLYDDENRQWRIKHLINRAYLPYAVNEDVIEYPQSIVGITIKSNTSRLIGDLSEAQIHRYYKTEPASSNGSFLAIPISSFNKCYGALCIESKEKHQYSKEDLETITRLTEQTASYLEILDLNEIINEYVIIDANTGVYSKKFFYQRLEEELQRADDSEIDLAFLLITVDQSAELLNRLGVEGFESVMNTLAGGIRASIRSYDLVGRLEKSQFGVLLVNTPANEGYLWAEKIRKNVSSHVISYEEKNFSITISIGVCGAQQDMKKEELIGNARTVLNKAIEAGGNAVRVF